MQHNMDSIIERANVLVEALPYISAFTGKTIVIKYGGNAMNDPVVMRTVMQDVAALKVVGVHPIVVHGGGPEINGMLKRLDIASRFENGLRVTDNETMEVVQMVLAGKVNKNLVSLLNTMGVKAVGLCGKDAGLIEVEKMPAKDGVDLGYVGRVKKINEQLLLALQNDFVPVIASIGTDAFGESYNVNADTAAGAIGGALKAEKLMFLTDIDGIRADEKDPKSLITKITVSEIRNMIATGQISGGMIPKVTGCIDAIEKGISSVLILNGTVPHSILLELFTDSGIGTMVTPG
ncbi:MAG: acetylglutamate kinase [Clostridia bacterium]|nr:acetylglutamate kinase [Clostridia bacterium]